MPLRQLIRFLATFDGSPFEETFALHFIVSFWIANMILSTTLASSKLLISQLVVYCQQVSYIPARLLQSSSYWWLFHNVSSYSWLVGPYSSNLLFFRRLVIRWLCCFLLSLASVTLSYCYIYFVLFALCLYVCMYVCFYECTMYCIECTAVLRKCFPCLPRGVLGTFLVAQKLIFPSSPAMLWKQVGDNFWCFWNFFARYCDNSLFRNVSRAFQLETSIFSCSFWSPRKMKRFFKRSLCNRQEGRHLCPLWSRMILRSSSWLEKEALARYSSYRSMS